MIITQTNGTPFLVIIMYPWKIASKTNPKIKNVLENENPT